MNKSIRKCSLRLIVILLSFSSCQKKVKTNDNSSVSGSESVSVDSVVENADNKSSNEDLIQNDKIENKKTNSNQQNISDSQINEEEKSSEKEILEFTVFTDESKKEKFVGVIKKNKIYIELPFEINEKKLIPSATISYGATILPENDTFCDLSNEATFTVTAEDNSEKTYSIVIEKESTCPGNEKHGIVINKVEYKKTNEKIIIPRNKEVVISGSDSSWKEFYSGNLEYYKGSFFSGRNVKLSSFVMSKYEVTQQLYEEILKSDETVDSCPSGFSSKPADGEVQGLRPVEKVTWYDAVYFCNALSESVGLEKVYTIENITRNLEKQIISADVIADTSKNGYCLPTEAEWEFAARGGNPQSANWNKAFSGTSSKFLNVENKDVDSNLDSYSWYLNTSSAKTHEVGLKKANSLGLYDMNGNVWEWCWDYYDVIGDSTDKDYTFNGQVVNPKGASSGSEKIIRGGSWFDSMYYNCVACRYKYSLKNACSDRGFRLIRHLN
jgi:formylglycine-generating enzyme required for sulfatase activity